MSTEQEKFDERKERQEHLEHQDALLSIASIIKTDEGRKLFKYLFKNFDIGELPDQNMEGNILHEYLGFLRAGNSIYKLTCQAASEEAGLILSKLEREKYDDLCEQYRIDHGFDASTSS